MYVSTVRPATVCAVANRQQISSDIIDGRWGHILSSGKAAAVALNHVLATILSKNMNRKNMLQSTGQLSENARLESRTRTDLPSVVTER